jgi:hypothetical protein
MEDEFGEYLANYGKPIDQWTDEDYAVYYQLEQQRYEEELQKYYLQY